MSGRWWFLAVGAVAILAAWFYTGGKRPYGYAGLGEVAVFVFFGLVATVGTVWLQSEIVPQEAWIAGAGVGLFAVAVLIANNTRDIATDRLAGKRTLSTRVGAVSYTHLDVYKRQQPTCAGSRDSSQRGARCRLKG